MSNALIFLLGASPADPIRWGRFADGRLLEGSRLENAAALSGLAQTADAADSVVAILPGEQVALRRMPAPPKSEAKFRSAAAYLLEDELAEPIGDLHVAVAMQESGGLAIAVRKRIIEQWIAAFVDAGVALNMLTADYLVLPSGAGQATAIFEEERAIVAIGGGGFAIETALLPDIAPSAFVERPERMTLYGDQTAA
ncbi:MAG: type II secretion system protein GspL, partial [Amphiplicatus sp.]